MESRVAQELGNYRLLSLLGQGGSGDLYLGEQIYLKTRVAVKVLRAHLDDEQISSFLSRSRTVARLEHPHIVRILDCDIKNGVPFLVMQYIPGGNLRQRIPKGTQAPLVEIVALATQAAAALDCMHQVGQIHGDVKPENLLLNERGELLISDFGLQLVGRHAPAGQLPERVGTIAYMAPEQLQGKLCPASDQYALGVVLYEWLCGEPPFHGTFAEIATQHALLTPEALRARRPDLSPQVEQVVLRALAKEPEQRFATVQDFTTALEQASKERPVVPGAARRVSRRALLLAGLGGAAMTSGGLVWAISARQKPVRSYPVHTMSFPTPVSPTPTVIENALFVYQQHSPIYCLAWSPDGARIATGEQAAIIQVWQATASSSAVMGSLLSKLSMPTNAPSTGTTKFAIKCLAWANDNARLTAGNFDTIEVWNSNTQQSLAVLNGETAQTLGNGLGTTVAWSPDGAHIACGGISTSAYPQVTLLSLPAGQIRIITPPNPPNALNQIPASAPLSLAWSPDGTAMAIGLIEGVVNVWRIADNSQISSYQGHQGGVSAIAWSPDGQYMASACGLTLSDTNNGTELTVHIWKVASGQKVLIYTGHKACINALAWSPDGMYLTSGSEDQTVQIWNATTGQTTSIYRGHTASITALNWSADGTRIASASVDGTTRIWKVER